MKNNKILLIIILVLIAVAVYFFITHGSSTLSKKTQKVNIDDTSVVNRIIIKSDSISSELIRKNDGWFVNNKYPAREKAILLILKNVSRLRLKSLASQSKDEVRHLKEKGTFAGFYNNDQVIKEYYFSHDDANLSMVDNEHLLYIELPGFQGSICQLFPSAESYWRSNLIFYHPLSRISSIVSGPPSHLDFRIENAGNGYFRMKDGNGKTVLNVNPKVLELFLLNFSHVEFEAPVNDTGLFEKYKQNIPETELSLTTVDNENVNVKIFPYYDTNRGKDNNHFYLILNGRELLKASAFQVGSLRKRLKDFELKK